MTKAVTTTGSRAAMPPMAEMRSVPAAQTRHPAARNREALAMPWVNA